MIYVGGARMIITSSDTCTSFKIHESFIKFYRRGFCGLLKERFVSVVAVYVCLTFQPVVFGRIR